MRPRVRRQDSFFEYLLKGYILFQDLELLDIFLSAYAAVEQHHSFEGFTYTVDMNKGLMVNTHLSPLACVWASLQVLIGDVASGLRSVLYWRPGPLTIADAGNLGWK